LYFQLQHAICLEVVKSLQIRITDNRMYTAYL